MSNNKMFVPGAALDGLRLALEAEDKKLRAEIENLRDRLYLASIKVADALAEASKLRAHFAELERERNSSEMNAEDLARVAFTRLYMYSPREEEDEMDKTRLQFLMRVINAIIGSGHAITRPLLHVRKPDPNEPNE